MNVARSINNWVKFHKTVTQLDRMNSRALQDVGVDRADIRRIAWESAAR